MMDFLSEKLVASDYCDRLKQDMRRATVCRFLVAYVSSGGVRSIGQDELVRVLQHEDSFGVSSLTCSCGYHPLLDLQQDIGTSDIRLKYFMDPKLVKTDEPDEIVLFHSKLVYLCLPDEAKSVVYIGSHNWTNRALGPGRPRNAEASVRFESEFASEHLMGSGTSVASKVNQHLLTAYNKPVCLSATPDNKRTFEQWYEWSCKSAPPSPLKPCTIVLAVREHDGAEIDPARWADLVGKSVYVQVLDPGEGETFRQANDRILVMVWRTLSDLRAGDQPILLRCHLSTQNPGRTSTVRGTNQANTPIAGFSGVLFDPEQLAAHRSSRRGTPSSVQIWSRQDVEFYSFEFPTLFADSSSVDRGVQPPDQFLLEVDDVVFPAEGDLPENPKLLWTRESFAVASSAEKAKFMRIPGYCVPTELREEIMACLTRDFEIEEGHAKTLPVSEFDRSKEGRRVSAHPLHDTFIGHRVRQQKKEFYFKAKSGALIAEIDEPDAETEGDSQARLFREPLARVQRVFATPLDRLREEWSGTANQFRAETDKTENG